MLILPERGLARGKILMPMRPALWRQPSQRAATFGIENQTRYRLTARLNDGFILWRGWFDDREDADAFLLSMVTGALLHERELWRLPTPAWSPDLGENLRYDFASVSFITSSPGSNQTFTSPIDWNNSNNTVEAIGGGAGGGGSAGSPLGAGVGGGGGAFASIGNFTFATPGTTTATCRVAAAGLGVSNAYAGNPGGDTWFNDTAFPTTGTKLGAKGAVPVDASVSPGGSASASYAPSGTKYDGGDGRGPTNGGGNWPTTGGGGAAGPNGAGKASGAHAGGAGNGSSGGGAANNGSVGGDASGTTGGLGGNNRLGTGGGAVNGGNGSSGGGGGGGNGPTGNGGNGSMDPVWDPTHGPGSGGGASTGNGSNAGVAGDAGLYGGGGGGGGFGAGSIGGDGGQGIIVATSTPVAGVGVDMSSLGIMCLP